MKQGKQTGTKSLNATSRAGRRQRLDRLACTALAVAIGMGLSTAAVAQAASVHPSVHDGHKPAVVKAANGTPVVNIVAPDKQGLSHNTYSRFDVGKDGLILNNSAAISRTQLAGYIYGNKHLKVSGPASIILNEVTSANPSVLQGYMEVAGTPAAVIVANPNGIACDGCGFINTPRAVLTTGTPLIGRNGRLDGFRVTRGSITIRGGGLDASHVDRVDLLARAIKVNGKLWAQHLNVVTGANRVGYGDLSATPIRGAGDKPEVSIDVAGLGGMYAGVIHLVGTEAGVGVNIQGETAAQAGDFTLTSAGKVVLDGKTTATGSVTVGSLRSVAVNGVLASGDDMHVQGHDLSLTGTVYSDKDIALAADGDIRNQGQVQAHAGVLRVQAGGTIANTAKGVLYAGNDMHLDGVALANAGDIAAGQAVRLQATGAVTNRGAVQAGHGLLLDAGTLANSGKLYALGGVWQATVRGAMLNDKTGDIYAAGNLTLHAGSLAQHGRVEAAQSLGITTADVLANDGAIQSDKAALTLYGRQIDNSGTLSAAGNLSLDADKALTNTAILVAGGDLDLHGGTVTSTGSIKAGKGIDLTSAGDADIAGKLYALGGSLGLDVAGTLTNQADGDIYGTRAVTVEVGSLDNTGSVAAAGKLAVTADALTNAGRMQADGALSLETAGNLVNTVDGAIDATGNVTLSSDATLHNAGTIYTDHHLGLGAVTLYNDGVLRSDADIGVHVDGSARNTGTAYAVGTTQWQVGDTLTNQGTLAASGNTAVSAGMLDGAGTLAAGLGSDGKLGARGDLSVVTAHVLQAGGRNLAAGAMTFTGTAVNLSGSQTFAGGNIGLDATSGDISLRGGTLTTDGTARLTAAGALTNGGKDEADGGTLSAGMLVLDVASIDNRHGTLEQSGTGDLAIRLDGAFDNAHGQLATNAGNLLLQAASFDNAHGSIRHAGSGTLTFTGTGMLDNTGGTITGNGGLAIQWTGAFDNTGGTVGVLGDAAVNADALVNVGGSLAAEAVTLTLAGDVDNTDGILQSAGLFKLDAGALTNGGQGKIKATGNEALAIILSGSLHNAAGAFIGGNGKVTLQTGTLANAGQVYAGTDLDVTTTVGDLDNQSGALQAMGALTLASAAALNNASGSIEAGAGQSAATLQVRAQSLDNHGGRLADTGSGATTLAITGDIDNQGGVLGGKGDVTLAADHVDSSGKGSKIVATGNLVLKLGKLENIGGTVYAAQDLAWNRAGASLINTDGANFGAGHDLALTLGDVDNADGNIDAGNDLALDLATFGGAGRVVAGHDLSLTLPGDYTNGQGNTLKANGDVTLDIGGDFVNPANANLLAVGKLTVNAATIANAENAVINSGHTVLVADGRLSNMGDIEGNNIDLMAGSLVNTGNIIGGYITADAGDLTNGKDLGHAIRASHYATSLIAATRGIDLYVTGTLLNRDAHIFSLGDMTLAANADGDRSHAIINRSGLIEASGSLYAAADQITNERRYYQFKTFKVSGITVVGWDGVNGDGVANTLMRPSVRGLRAMMLPPVDPGDPGNPGTGGGDLPGPSKHQETDYLVWWKAGPAVVDYCQGGGSANGATWGCDGDATEGITKQLDTWTVTSANVLVAASAESRITAGKNIVLNGSLLNDSSTVAAGGNLRINGSARSTDVTQGKSCHGGVCNIAHAPTLGFSHTRRIEVAWKQRHSCGLGGMDHCWEWQSAHVIVIRNDNAPPDGDTSWVSEAGLDIGPSLSAHLTANGDVSIDAGHIHNTVVDPEGHPVRGALGLGANHAGQPVSGAGSHQVDPVGGSAGTGSDVTLGQVPGMGPGGHHDGVDLAPPQTVDSLTGSDADIRLPHSGLYTVNHDPGSSYLVETDPRFTDYAKFISSDYLLGKLGYDPAAMDKRLGDGFYEQRQVLDQITTLTGRRFLASHMDALSQYRALMNNAAVAAKKFDFEVGVALTAEQMAALTHDIVWLVKEEVGGQTVLAPVVYLSQASANQLGQPGAVIAGRNVILNASGDIASNGRIVARRNATLKADNLLNSGAITAGGNLGIQTARNILNQGGVMRGTNVTLAAGGDVVSRADIGPVHLAGVDLGALDTGSIRATRDLQIAAGSDIALDQVNLHAGHDIQLVAGRDLIATATGMHAGNDLGVLVGRDIALNATASHASNLRGNTFTRTTTHHVTDLEAGGNLQVVAGHDLASHGATLDAGKRMGIAAGHDITLATVTDHKHVDTHGWHGDTRFHKVTDDDTLRATQLHAGQGINVSAGHDATLVATQIASDHGNVALAAGHDLALAAGHENHTTVVDTYHHDSGFLSSSTTTTHDVTDNTLAVGAHIKGDNVHLAAGHDLTTQGAAVQAGKALNLAAGHDIHLGASHDIYRQQHRRHHTESSFSTDLILGVGDGQLYTKTTDDQQGMRVNTIANGTLLSGDTVSAMAGHDITAQGAQIAATHDLAMVAGHDLVIDAAANTYNRKQQHKHRVDGWQRSGLVQMVGTTKTRQRAKGGEVGYTGSVLGSTEGRVRLVAGNNVHITGSDVISQAGTAITGKNVTIDAALGSSDTRNEYSMHRAGIMGGVGGMVGNLANSAVGVYESGKHTGQVKDKRLKALYAAQTAYQAYDLYNDGKAVASKGASGGMGGTGISLKISLGASTANSHANTHDDIAYGSHIRSQGDIAIAATDGDLNVIGSQIQGNNVALAASHDLNLLSQIEHHTQKQSGAHAGGQIGVSIGETTGIFLSLNGGKRRAHGNGTTHAITTVDADGTLSLIAGHDALLKGAQARGQTLLADIGHNLTLVSEQDTGDFASKQWNAGFTLVYGWAKGGVGFSGHASAAGMNNHYKSVTQTTGLAAGDGGFQIHVGGRTDLKGAVIASTADPYKNWLDTGSLTWSDIHNEAKYDSWSFSVGGGAGQSLSGKSMAGLTGGLGIPQSHDQSSTTRAGIAKGTITVRNGSQNLAGLNRNPDIDAKGLTRKFDRQELAEQQEMGKVAGYVGMRTAGLIAEHEQKLAARDLANATTDKDAAEAQARLDRWSTGGTYKDILHGMVGAATAALGGGNALNGALGATASEMASGQMEQYLVAHHINPDSPKGRSLMELASTAIGAAAGGGAGAATALQGEKYNRQLHVDTIDYITKHMAAKFAETHDMTVLEAQRILLRQAMRMTDDYNDRFLSTTDSPEMQAAAKAFLTGRNPVGVDGYLYDLFPSAEDKANSKMGAYDLVKNKAAYGAVLDALATGMMKKNGQASMKDYQTDMWALDGRYRDRGTGLAWDEAWRHHVNQEDLAFLKLYGETALAGATAGVGAEFAVLGGVLSGGVSGYMSNGWKGAVVGAVVGGAVGKFAPVATNVLAPVAKEGGISIMFGRAAIFSGINGFGSGAGTYMTNVWEGKAPMDGMAQSIAIGALAPVGSGESFLWGAGGDLVYGTKVANGYGWATGVLSVGAESLDPNAEHGFFDSPLYLQSVSSSKPRGSDSLNAVPLSNTSQTTCISSASSDSRQSPLAYCKELP